MWKLKYQVLAKYLLGRVVVADTIDHAIALARKFRYSLRIVTLEGELLSAGGSMTGGAFKNSSNLLGRKRELEELEAACQKALKASDRLQEELTMNEGLAQQKKEELESLKAEHHQVSLLVNTRQMSVSQLEDKREEIRGLLPGSRAGEQPAGEPDQRDRGRQKEAGPGTRSS